MKSSSGHRKRAPTAQRRQLRSPSGFRLAIADSIFQLDRAQWDGIVEGQSWFFSRQYLAMLEHVPPSVIQPRYALISDDEGPIAAVVLQWVEVDGSRLRPLAREPDDEINPLRRMVEELTRPARGTVAARLRERVLVCGNLLTYGQHAVAFSPDVEPDGVWPAVAEVLYRLRRAEKVAGQAGFVLVKDVPDDQRHGVSQLEGLDYRGIATEPDMVLAIDPGWTSHADYLGSMDATFRDTVENQILAPIRQAGLWVRTFLPVGLLGQRAHDLYLAVHEDEGLRPFTLHPGYFEALAATAGARVRFTGLFDSPEDRPEALRGFIVTLADADQALGYHLGFERSGAQDLPLYLRLLHASIADAIAMRAGNLSFGRTALVPKTHLGAKPRDMQVWLRHRQPVFNQIVYKLVGLAHHAETPETSAPRKTSPPARRQEEASARPPRQPQPQQQQGSQRVPRTPTT